MQLKTHLTDDTNGSQKPHTDLPHTGLEPRSQIGLTEHKNSQTRPLVPPAADLDGIIFIAPFSIRKSSESDNSRIISLEKNAASSQSKDRLFPHRTPWFWKHRAHPGLLYLVSLRASQNTRVLLVEFAIGEKRISSIFLQ